MNCCTIAVHEEVCHLHGDPRVRLTRLALGATSLHARHVARGRLILVLGTSCVRSTSSCILTPYDILAGILKRHFLIIRITISSVCIHGRQVLERAKVE